MHAARLFALRYQIAHGGDEVDAHAADVCERELLARFGLECVAFDPSGAESMS